MLIRITSDVHLEGYMDQQLPENVNWDMVMVPPMPRDKEAVLVLAGDICEFQYVEKLTRDWSRLAQRFAAVVYVPGNHEYWGSPNTPYCDNTIVRIKESLRKLGKMHVLDNKSVTIKGVKFYGMSLWTNYDDSPVARVTASRMGDFRYAYDMTDGVIPRAARPGDYVNRNQFALAKFKTFASRTDLSNVVVVSHFAPSHQSIHPKWKDAQPYEMNYHFVNELDGLICEHPGLKLWIHGHTHTQFDYNISNCRVVCNPRGFPGEFTDKQKDLNYIEV